MVGPRNDFSKHSGRSHRFGIVVSRYHQVVTRKLLAGAIRVLKRHGVRPPDIQVVWVPGSFELPLAARYVAERSQVDGLVCLGVIIQGETPHHDYLAREVTHGVARVGHETGLPIGLGVLTTYNLDQARERAGGRLGNKGEEAAEAAVALLQLQTSLRGTHGTSQ